MQSDNIAFNDVLGRCNWFSVRINGIFVFFL